MLCIAIMLLQALLQKLWHSLSDTKRWRKICLLAWKVGAEAFERDETGSTGHWGRDREARAWGGRKGAGFSLVREEGYQTSSEKCYQTGSGSKCYLGKKVMRGVNCESEKGQVSSVEKKGEISEALKFIWQKVRPSRCRVRGNSSISSKEDLSQDNPDRVPHNSLLNLYVEQTWSWSRYSQGLGAGHR